MRAWAHTNGQTLPREHTIFNKEDAELTNGYQPSVLEVSNGATLADKVARALQVKQDPQPNYESPLPHRHAERAITPPQRSTIRRIEEEVRAAAVVQPHRETHRTSPSHPISHHHTERRNMRVILSILDRLIRDMDARESTSSFKRMRLSELRRYLQRQDVASFDNRMKNHILLLTRRICNIHGATIPIHVWAPDAAYTFNRLLDTEEWQQPTEEIMLEDSQIRALPIENLLMPGRRSSPEQVARENMRIAIAILNDLIIDTGGSSSGHLFKPAKLTQLRNYLQRQSADSFDDNMKNRVLLLTRRICNTYNNNSLPFHFFSPDGASTFNSLLAHHGWQQPTGELVLDDSQIRNYSISSLLQTCFYDTTARQRSRIGIDFG